MFVWLVDGAVVVFTAAFAVLGVGSARWRSGRGAASEARRALRAEGRMWVMINRHRTRQDRKELRAASSEEMFTELDRWTSS